MNKQYRITAILAILALSGLQACSDGAQDSDTPACTAGATQCDGNTVKKCNAQGVFEVLKTCSDLGEGYVCDTTDGVADCRKPETDGDPKRETCPAGMTASCISGDVLRYCGSDGFVAEKSCADMGESYVCGTKDGVADCRESDPDPDDGPKRETCPENMTASCISDGVLRYCGEDGYIAEKTCADMGESYVCNTADGAADCRKPKTDADPDREPCPAGMANSCISSGILRYCGADGYIAEKTCADMGESYVCITQYGMGKCSKPSTDPNREVCPAGMVKSCASNDILRYCGTDGYIAEKACSDMGESYVCETQNGAGKCSKSIVLEIARCSNAAVCRNDKSCKDVGTCVYTCGTGNTCQWPVCSGTYNCQGSATCDPATLPVGINNDFDNDGISNAVELISKILDPCSADTDGDTIPDNEEDLNKNGIYEPELGETHPNDPDSKPTAEEAAAARAVCPYDDQNTISVTILADFNVAMPQSLGDSQIAGHVFADDDGKTGVAFFDAAEEGIAFFFASSGGDAIGAQELFGKISQLPAYETPISAYAEESAATSAVPQQSWIGGGYNAGLQTVPNHEIDRHIFSVTIKPGETINDVRRVLTKYLFGKSMSSSAFNSCQTDETDNSSASVWMARSIYKGKGETAADKTIAVYSAAVACSENLSEPAIKTLMNAILSGTHVAPNGLSSSVLGYNAKSRLKCQKGSLSAAAVQDETYSLVLQGYPVASTIRVAAVKQGGDTAKELEAGKDWTYDAAKNAVAFSCADCEASDTFAISYVLWEKITG